MSCPRFLPFPPSQLAEKQIIFFTSHGIRLSPPPFIQSPSSSPPHPIASVQSPSVQSPSVQSPSSSRLLPTTFSTSCSIQRVGSMYHYGTPKCTATKERFTLFSLGDRVQRPCGVLCRKHFWHRLVHCSVWQNL